MNDAEMKMFEQARKLKGATPEIDETFPDKPLTMDDMPPAYPVNAPKMPQVEVLPSTPTPVESEFVVFTEVEKDGFVWKPTFRKGITPKEIDNVILLMETATAKFKAKGFTYHETKRGGGFPKTPPKAAGTNCQKCGAPENVSQAGKSYCSKLCWKNQ